MTDHSTPRPTSHSLPAHILREYDIRGVVGTELSAADAYAIGRSFATMIARSDVVPPDTEPHSPPPRNKAIAVGYDGRLTSPMLEDALVAGIMDSGVDVLRIGLGPTPMLYYAASTEQVDGGIQITGSHNPSDYNGFKLMFETRPFFGNDIRRLGDIAMRGQWTIGKGRVKNCDIMARYVARLLEGLPQGLPSEFPQRFGDSPYRIAWDAGNGAAGPIVERLVPHLPGTHHLLFTDVDGHFPNHPPDPTEETNLTALRDLVMDKQLHFGVAFDGDGDRLVVVDSDGTMMLGDQLLQIYVTDVLRDHPGATIIADVKASQTLFDHIAALGGVPLMWKTGHSHIKSKMQEVAKIPGVECPLAGEMSGHIFFADRYYGYDDALYAAVRLIAALQRLGTSVTALRQAMPKMSSTSELRFAVEESRKFAIVDEVIARLVTAGADINRTDGARVMTADGWWLLRASNTQAVLVARAEAHDEAALAQLVTALDAQLALSGVAREG